MACGCNKKVNKKYLSENEQNELDIRQFNGIEKIGNAIGQFFFGIIISLVMIVGFIPFAVYIMFCICTGRNMSVRIPDLAKWNKKEK